MDERRKLSRLGVVKAGVITGEGIHEPIACTLTDISADGACLRFPFPTGIPPRFVLSLVAGNVSIACRVAWERSGEFGVEFEAPEAADLKRQPRSTIGDDVAAARRPPEPGRTA